MNLDFMETIPYFLSRWYERVEDSSDKTLIVDGQGDRSFSVTEVEQISGRIYSYLKNHNVGADDFVMIDMPRGGEAVICMLGVWKAGAAFTIVEDDYAPDRIAYIRRDVGCKVFLDKELYENIKKGDYEKGYREAELHDAAFAVYTSGTTGFPKGIVHEYGNIKLNSMSGRAKTGRRVSKDSHYSVISPFNFVATVKIVLSLVQLGFTAYIIPYDIVKNPLKLKTYFTEHEISVAFLSPSILRIIGKDLPSSMQCVFTGSEPANGIALDGIRLINTYSMSEGAFTLAQFEIDRAYDICPVGKPNYEGINLRILDEDGNDLPNGEVGEIAFENPFMRGYINLPEETARVLKDGVYHTGDLGKKLPDGNLILLGRANDMIKINGNRIEPAEIEKAFKNVTGKDFACAKGFEETAQSFICLYYTGDDEIEEKEVREKMRSMLPYYMIPSYFVHIAEVPLLPNGKINKKVLTAPNKKNYDTPYEAPADDLEKQMCEAMARVLHRERVGVNDDFYQLGGDSLTAMALLAELSFDDLTAADIFNGCTVRNIAGIYRKRLEKNSGVSKEEYEMAARNMALKPFAVQISLIDVQLNAPKHPVFNIPLCYSFEDVSIAAKLCEALNKVIANSPIFSTVFEYDEDCNFVERFVPGLFGEVEVKKVTEEEFENIKAEYLSYFKKLFNAPLCRAGIFVTEKCGYMLLNFHHALIDGMGTQVVLRKLMAAYRGEDLPMDTFYTTLRRSIENEATDAYREAGDYMESTYGKIPFSRNFETDKCAGNDVQAVYPAPLQLTPADMDAFEKKTGFTRNQLCSAVLLIAMAKCNSCKDVIMSSAFHNRVDQASKNALGIQLRKVPTALRLGEYQNAREILESIQQQSVNAIRYCAYEYVIDSEELFVSDYIAMTYETSEITSADSSGGIGLKSCPCAASDPYAAIRMAFMIMEKKSSIAYLLIYSSKYYSEERVAQCGQAIADVMTAILSADKLEELSVEELSTFHSYS